MAIYSEQFIAEVHLKRESIDNFEEYPFCLDAVRLLKSLVMNPKVTFLVGENGSGKSTLLEAIAVRWGFNAEGGSRNFNFKTRESHSILHKHLILSKGIRKPRTDYFLRAESFFNVATNIEELDNTGGVGAPVIEGYGGHSLHEQSHGESFMALLMNRFGPKGLYILDEPEAALSPARILALIVRMKELTDQGSQFIIATHSPILMAFPGATIFALGEDGAKETEFKNTQHWSLTERFMRQPDVMLDQLLNEETSG